MSFNISGIAISESYLLKVEELAKFIGCELVFEQEVLLETASENWKEKGICDICFFEKGTIIFLPDDSSIMPAKAANETVISFVISDSTETYSFEKYRNGELIRSFEEIEGKKQKAKGEKLAEEDDFKTTTDFIWAQVSAVLGQNFWAAPTDFKAYRYKFMNRKLKRKLEEEENYNPKPVSELRVKPWWKFW